MAPRATELSRRAVRWILPATFLVLTPKCLLCVVAYVGLGTVLGVGGPEICSATAGAPRVWDLSLASLGLAAGLGAVGFLVSRRCGRSGETAESHAGSAGTTTFRTSGEGYPVFTRAASMGRNAER